MRCAHTEVRLLYCTTELCLSVDKTGKDNKQGRNDISVQCLCKIYVLSRVENWEKLTTSRNTRSRTDGDGVLLLESGLAPTSQNLCQAVQMPRDTGQQKTERAQRYQ